MTLNQRIAVVDIEATGPDIEKGDRIIQIAMVMIEENQIVAEYSELINPEIDIPEHITQLTGITDEIVKTAPTIEQVVHEWHDRLKDAVLVAHHLAFDLNVLQTTFEQFGLRYTPIAVDTVRLSKILFPTAISFSLSDLARTFHVEFLDAHNALNDAKFTSWLLNQLATTYLQQDDVFNHRDEALIQMLDHDDALFFEQTAAFIINNRPTYEYVTDSLTESPNSSSNKLMGQWIKEQANTFDRLVIESRYQPISTTMLDEIIELPASLTIVTDEEQLNKLAVNNHQILRKPRSYLDPSIVGDLIVNEIPWNQQELVTLLGTRFWLKTTETFDLTELHDELDILSLLERYLPTRHLPMRPFEEQLKKTLKSSNIFMLHSDFISLLQSESDVWELLLSRHLIIQDIDVFTSIAKWQLSKSWRISDTFVEWRKIIDYFLFYSERYIPLKSIEDEMHELTLDFTSLIHQTEMIILEKFGDEDCFEVFVDLNNKTFRDLMHEMRNLIKSHLRLFEQVNYHLPKDILRNLEHLNNTLTEMLKEPKNVYYVLTGEMIDKKLYHLVLEQKHLKIPEAFSIKLQQFRRCLYLSNHDLQPALSFGLFNQLNDQTLKHLLTPKLQYKAPMSVSVLPSYGTLSSQNINYDAQLFEPLPSLMEDYLLTNPKQSVLMIMSNREQARRLVSYLHEQMNLETYEIFTAKTIASLPKVYRRALDSQQFIFVLTQYQFESSHLNFPDHSVDVFIQRLPFTSLNAPMNLALKSVLPENESLFDDYVLFTMIRRFKKTLDLIKTMDGTKSVYLIDDRIFTQSYSRQLLKLLNFVAEFHVNDTFR